MTRGEVWPKLGLAQRTASSKYRGAINKILSLSEEELNRGAVSASTENYPLAVAEAMLADTCAGCVDQEVFKKIIA